MNDEDALRQNSKLSFSVERAADFTPLTN